MLGIRILDELFDGFDEVMKDPDFVSARNTYRYWARTKTEKTDNGHRITIEVPGMSSEDVDVSVAERVMTVKYGEHSQDFTLSQHVDVDKITASVKHGILKIHVPQHKHEAISRKITVT